MKLEEFFKKLKLFKESVLFKLQDILRRQHLASVRDFFKELIHIQHLFKSYYPLIVFSVGVGFLLSALLIFREDGMAVLASQKDGLVLEVFSRTDLTSEQNTLLRESLLAMDGVNELDFISPDEALKKLSVESKLDIETEWLAQKSNELKGIATVLPGTYRLHLMRWDELFLNSLISKIEVLEVGTPKVQPVAEIHYDKERWELIYLLYNYLRWLNGILIALFAMLVFFAADFVVRRIRLKEKLVRRKTELAQILLCGVFSGIVSHLFSLFVLSVSFFSDSFSWKENIGKDGLIQIFVSTFVFFLLYEYHLFHKTRGSGSLH